MCILGYRNLQNCGELDHPVQLDRQRIRAFGLDNEWTDPIEPVHWFYTAAAPILRQTYRQQRPDLSDEEFARIRASPRPRMLRQIAAAENEFCTIYHFPAPLREAPQNNLNNFTALALGFSGGWYSSTRREIHGAQYSGNASDRPLL